VNRKRVQQLTESLHPSDSSLPDPPANQLRASRQDLLKQVANPAQLGFESISMDFGYQPAMDSWADYFGLTLRLHFTLHTGTVGYALPLGIDRLTRSTHPR
jgi:hypothetical protein